MIAYEDVQRRPFLLGEGPLIGRIATSIEIPQRSAAAGAHQFSPATSIFDFGSPLTHPNTCQRLVIQSPVPALPFPAPHGSLQASPPLRCVPCLEFLTLSRRQCRSLTHTAHLFLWALILFLPLILHAPTLPPITVANRPRSSFTALRRWRSLRTF